MSKLKKVLFLLSSLMIIWHAINYFFYKEDLIKTLFNIIPLILLILITLLKKIKKRNEKIT